MKVYEDGGEEIKKKEEKQGIAILFFEMLLNWSLVLGDVKNVSHCEIL